MSYNPIFNNNFNQSNFTFQNNLNYSPFLPPPPPPPQILYPPSLELSDQEYVKSFEMKNPNVIKRKCVKTSVSQLCGKMRAALLAYESIQGKYEELKENKDCYSDEEWHSAFKSIESNKSTITDIIAELNSSYLEESSRTLVKRAAKRLRLKRLGETRKKEKRERIKELEERSRLIDENLKKINDEILKKKQEQEAMQQADVVLKDVRKKKHEAKKNISKLEALIKLRRARQNTAKGRGEAHCENDDVAFQEHIEKLKVMWKQKLSLYEAEESDLRSKLQQGGGLGPTESEAEDGGAAGLGRWRLAMFGAHQPQADYSGDVHKFIAIRGEWDRFIDGDGAPVPLRWAQPAPRRPHDP